MTNYERITVECFRERVENFIMEYEKLTSENNENYSAFESLAFDLLYELKRDIDENKKY